MMQETIPIETQMRHLGQKYLGARPETHAQAVFQGGNTHISKDHPLPISNFMNAQCSYFPDQYVPLKYAPANAVFRFLRD